MLRERRLARECAKSQGAKFSQVFDGARKIIALKFFGKKKRALDSSRVLWMALQVVMNRWSEHQ